MSVLGPKDYLDLGNWNVICDRCGAKFKGSELIREWQGYMVCRDCYEPRQPQDLIRLPKERQNAPYVRPVGIDQFVTVAPVDPNAL